MNNKYSREKQAAVLRRTQEKRKQQKKEQVLKAVKEILTRGKPMTFPNIAKVAGCSVSYLYKWDDIKAYIHELQNDQGTQLQQLEDKKTTPHSLKTLHEVSKQRIRELEAEIKEVKRQNEIYRGHIAEIYELRDEIERLRSNLRELTSPQSSSKVIPIQKSNQEDIPSDVAQMLKEMGISLGVRLQREIKQHDPSKVKLSIAAFIQYRSTTAVSNPGGCLLSMIREEAEPNIQLQPTRKRELEFDNWYAKAIQVGFCLNVPKNYLSTINNEYQVKVKSNESPGGYQPVNWQEAKTMMENR